MAVKIAMIGCGGRNRAHFQKLKLMEDIEFVGFCDIIEDRAKAYRSEVTSGEIFTDFRDLLAKTTPDAVYIAVPPDQHGDIERLVIDKGINFTVEKPIALDIKTCEELEARVKEKNLITAAGFQDRYQRLTEIMKDYLKDKQVGIANAYWVGGIPRVEWWRVKARSGGQLVEQNVHLVDQARYLFGEVESVYCVGGKGIVDGPAWGVPGYDVEDYSCAILKMKSGVVVNVLTGCYIQPGGGAPNGMEVYCKDATLNYSLRNSLRIRDKDGDKMYVRTDEEKNGLTEQTGIMDLAFIKAVRTGDRSGIRADYSEAVKTMRVVLACNESMETGKPVIL